MSIISPKNILSALAGLTAAFCLAGSLVSTHRGLEFLSIDADDIFEGTHFRLTHAEAEDLVKKETTTIGLTQLAFGAVETGVGVLFAAGACRIAKLGNE